MAEKKQKQTFFTRLHECCGDDELRPLMQCVKFENGYAYAGNGMVAIKQTLALCGVINPENLDGKYLHKDSYKAIMSFEIAEANTDGVECWNENGQRVFFAYTEPPKDGNIDWESGMKKKKGLTGVTFIGFNPEQFAKLAKALYAPGGNIRVQFTGIDTAMLVDVVGVDEQEAIIMPYILNNTLFG